MERVVGVHLRDEADVAAVRRLRAVGVAVCEFDTEDALITAAATRGYAVAVCELTPFREDRVRWALDRMALAPSTATILRAELSCNVVRGIVSLSAHPGLARLSLRSVRPADVDVQEALRGTSHAPDFLILRSFATDRLAREPGILIAAIVCGARRTRIRTLARACRIAPRTLQWRLARAGFPEARELLGWVLALHSVWRLEALEWPLKRVAAQAGFSSGESLCSYVHRHVGARPKTLCRDGGFWQLLAQFASLFE